MTYIQSHAVFIPILTHVVGDCSTSLGSEALYERRDKQNHQQDDNVALQVSMQYDFTC